ncbi:hypothetical protein HME9302_00626 [Alteripontixanthobacter maritimus]|uniref:YlxR domain-containing protein n=1 Tax=Alteripontixanthobacter maritimus TaxID=2161824 RepID=A0A369QAZ5_9SPHN|nr:DUF448 domain-containing protein [Alteripontixanthobacter maritimus]RDC59438.1 hypothetical protein HME9302_00626 [Alteripontixanthobacter maritimus]
MRTPPNESVSSAIAEPGADVSARPSARPRKIEPERKCVLSGEHGGRSTLIRLAISPEGDVLPDLLARAPGRGAWIGVTRSELETAIMKGRLRGALARAFNGAPLTVPDDLAKRIETGLVRLLLDRLGLAMRSGALILGSDKIAEKARAGRIDLLLHASDASEDGTRKLDQAWRVGRDVEGSGQRGIRLPVITAGEIRFALDRDALSVALGRDNVVHLALVGAPAADRVSQTLQRLLHFLGLAEAGASLNTNGSDIDDELRTGKT